MKGSTLRLDAAAETSDHARALQLLAAPIWLLLLIQSGCCCLPLGLPLLQLDARGLLLLFLANLLRSRRYAVGKPAMLADVVADEPQCNHPPMLPLEEEFPCRGGTDGEPSGRRRWRRARTRPRRERRSPAGACSRGGSRGRGNRRTSSRHVSQTLRSPSSGVVGGSSWRSTSLPALSAALRFSRVERVAADHGWMDDGTREEEG